MPNRLIRIGFIDSESINLLSDSAESFYVRLALICDDAGRYDGRIEMIRSNAYPIKDIKVSEVKKRLDECVKVGLVIPYTRDGKAFIQLTKWQRCSPCSVSKFPWVDGSHKIDYLKLDTRDGLKDFVKTSIPDPMAIPSVSHTPPFGGLSCQCSETETETETETKLETVLGENIDQLKESFMKNAQQVIDYLNLKAGTGFLHSETSVKPILARLKEGVTIDQCKLVIDAQCKLWLRDAKMEGFLRPKTLFSGENFSNYLGTALRTPSQVKMPSSSEVIA